MTKSETMKLISIISGTYANWNIGDMEFTSNIWHELLGNYEYNLLQSAFKVYALTPGNKFAPSPSDIVEALANISTNEYETKEEAWQKVNKAISNSNYHNGEEADKMNDKYRLAFVGTTDKRAVSDELHRLAESWQWDVYAIQRAEKSFKENWDKLVNEAKKFDIMPNDMKKLMIESNSAPKLSIINAEEKRIALETKENNLLLEEK